MFINIMPREYKLIAGRKSKNLKKADECKKIYAAFSPLISSIAKCLKSNSIKSGEFTFSKEDEKLNLKFLNKDGKNGEILVEIAESKGDSLGAPYYSSWDGLFYRLPRNKKKPFAENGQFVKNGNPIGIVFINKNEQFILNAPADGFIYFPDGDKHLNRGLPIKTYDQTDSENSKPIFYLK